MNDLRKLFDKATMEWESENYKVAFGLFKSAAEQGDSASQNNLGYFYDEGIGVEANKEKAIYWYKKAIENGEICSCTNLAKIYQDKGDIETSVQWLNKAIQAGDGDAALQLAKLYLDSNLADKKEKAKENLLIVLKSHSVIPDSIEEAKELLGKLA